MVPIDHRSLTDSMTRTEVFDYYPSLQKVREYVISHMTESVSLATAAQITGLEKTYFSKFFHKKTGLPFRDWLWSMRVQQAMVLIREKDSSISRIAHETGFSSIRAFERAFRQHAGLSARTYRSQVRPDSNSGANSTTSVAKKPS